MPHALLVRGPQGVGKLGFAESVAQALLCEQPTGEGAACGRCPACGWVEHGAHPDLRRLEPESLAASAESDAGSERRASTQIGVEAVRSIADFVAITSHRGGAKVILIHPAEALNVNAANALLKGLEEPPPNTYFLLVSHRWHQLPATVLSRCQDIAIPVPPMAEAKAWLDGQGAQQGELALADAGGAPLLAQRLDAEYWRAREAFFRAIARDDFDAMAVADQLRDHAPALVVGWLQKWSYDLVSHAASGRIRYNVDLAKAVATTAARIDIRQAARFQRQMVRLQRIVAHPLNARLFLEHLLLSYKGLLRGRPLEQAA